ncbi:hypothetical protein SAMN05421806_105468 [Streptomyces indicus]|uniref:Uncharacterized protein n=2 Tax=Streptomyces indicus TaxID=417292 RepID=A0A1G9AC67_9ACTN|nr:hypothetical protein SAMN05421806_105468 [Streptomyces indicus]
MELREVNTVPSTPPLPRSAPDLPRSVPGPPPSPHSPKVEPHQTGVIDTEFLKIAPERFNTVIAYVDEDRPGWIADIPWGELLDVAGLLVFITHCRGDDLGARNLREGVTDTARDAGLTQLDRIALFAVPPRTHADLLVFLRPLPSTKGRLR